MITANPTTTNMSNIIHKLENGELKVPQFQRDFVWNMEASAKLIDSLLKGYPIGSFTFWKTKERLRTVKNIGGIDFEESPSNDYVYYVLDGQQRITSMYASVKGALVNNDDFSKMYINLNALESESLVILDNSELGLNEDEYISVADLIKCDLSKLFIRYGSREGMIDKINDYKNRINTYLFSAIEVENAPIDIATEIFTRINTGGKPLTVFEIMCAKTYDETRCFDLYEKREEQIEKWESRNYDTVANQTVLQAISMCIQKTCKRRDILNLDKNVFIDEWTKIDEAFNCTIDYLKNFYSIPVSKLLPYDALLVPFVYYFYNNNNKKPEGNSARQIQDYFWRCVITKRFTEGVESKLAADCINVIDKVLAGEEIEAKALEPVDITVKTIENSGEFTLSSAYIKGLLCILVAQHPKSFNDGTNVVVDNAWLSQTNSKNYHHFFPKAYMKRNQQLIDPDLVNHIANITIVDSFLNKNLIKDKAPSEYMKKFREDNLDLANTMKTHLIDVNEFGIWEDNYNVFFSKRVGLIQEELKKRIIVREYDSV